MLIGAHVRARGGIEQSITNALAIGADVMQTHPTSAQQWRQVEFDPDRAAQFRETYAGSGVRGHWLHAIYLINLATPKPGLLEQSVGSLLHYMEIAGQLGADGVVFHPGSHVGTGFDEQLPQIHEAIRRVLAASDVNARLLIENSAGSGGCVGCSFDEVGRMLEASDDPRLGVCLDTQHMFASGYDVRTPEMREQTFTAFERAIGFERLALVHANDSRKALGSNVDRHANIGDGEIGVDSFTGMFEDSRLRAVPWVLEVPGEGEGPNRQQIDLLRDCAARAVQMKPAAQRIATA